MPPNGPVFALQIVLNSNMTVGVGISGNMPPRHLLLMMIEEAKEYLLQKHHRGNPGDKPQIQVAPASFLSGDQS